MVTPWLCGLRDFMSEVMRLYCLIIPFWPSAEIRKVAGKGQSSLTGAVSCFELCAVFKRGAFFAGKGGLKDLFCGYNPVSKLNVLWT